MENRGMNKEGLTGGWTKHGGGRLSPIKSKIKGQWYCQSCAQALPEQIKPQLYEYAEEEYIRVCAKCFNVGCKTFWQRRLQT